ncbi:arsenate reductase [Gemmobacter caeni]|uniref:Arsenate reductase n=1 Tax=Gemmobacter caeni TaxID=589035 RepID=A0A2T6BBI2_9RHOB|nr:arsenate reductase (glutaredoxin) [Gemmobacter caeni]PTX53451.1 arsenate reductase [Gemmobacter caeni]TWJ05562.1 arsenate reductase [Gemmobacter caeni]
MTKTDFPVTIWHNPGCSTSRKALQAIRDAGVDPRVIRYLETGWEEAGLRALLEAAGLTPTQALRRKGDLVAELGLAAAGDATIFAAMLAHPVLVERPFVQSPQGTALCRPLERLTPLLP